MSACPGEGCTHPECVNFRAYTIDNATAGDTELGRVNVLVSPTSTVMSNMEFGGWVAQRDGSLVSVEYAKTLNRAERRKRGIKL